MLAYSLVVKAGEFMKKLLLAIVALFLGTSCFAVQYFGVQLPLKGQTITDKRTQSIALGYVFAKLNKEVKHCRKFDIVNTKVITQPQNVVINKTGRKISGTWSEEWTVSACGENKVVPIYFENRRNGTMPIVY